MNTMNTHTHTRLTTLCSGLPGWKVKAIWNLLKQETVSGSGISWAVCKSAPRFRQKTTLAPHHSVFFTVRVLFLPPNRQRQSTEGKSPAGLIVSSSTTGPLREGRLLLPTWRLAIASSLPLWCSIFCEIKHKVCKLPEVLFFYYYLFITPLRQHSKIQADKQYRTHKHHAR